MPDTTTTTDKVTAYLAEVERDLADGAAYPRRVMELHGPHLLAAVKAALGDHDNRGVFLGADECDHPEPPRPQARSAQATEWDDWDADHPLGAGDVGRICLLTEIGRYCPACTQLVYEDDSVGDSYVNAADCIALPAISAALLGEK